VQRICILDTDSLTKSGKSTVSFAFLGKIYRFFDEIRHVKDRSFGPKFLSLKAASCLSEFTQTWRENPANSSDMVSFSGKSFRHGEKIRRVVTSTVRAVTSTGRAPSEILAKRKPRTSGMYGV